MKLAYEIVKLYHGEDKAVDSEQYFISTIQHKEIPEEIREINISCDKLINGKLDPVNLLLVVDKTVSKSEWRRLIKQGGIKINGEKITDDFSKIDIKCNDILQFGKRKFIKIKK